MSLTATAGAKIGTGVGARPLALPTDLQAGGGYRFPSLYVVNTGTVTSTYRIKVQRLGAGHGRDVPPSWLRLSHARLRLQPHESRFVAVRVTVPKTATAGAYATNLVVGTSTPRLDQGAALGAAAADELGFTVAGPSGFEWSSRWLVYPILSALAIAALVVLARRLGLRVELDRRQ